MSYLEETQVELDIKPQAKGKLPDVRLKDPQNMSKSETLAELVTHLLLHKYQKLLAKLQALKAKLEALPPVQLFVKTKNLLVASATKYKEKGQLSTAGLKTKMTAQLNSYMTKVQQKTKMLERWQGFRNKFTEKTGQVKEDIREIQEQVKDIVRSAVQKDAGSSSQPKIK